MAGLNADAITTAIIERIDGTLTGARAIASGWMSRGDMPWLDDGERSRRALYAPTIDAEITSTRLHPSAALSEIGSIQILECAAEVRCTYQFPTELQALDTGTDIRTLRNRAVADAELIRQSLMFPAGLETTSAAVATGIITSLNLVRSEKQDEDPDAAMIRWVHEFTFAVKVEPSGDLVLVLTP